MKSIWSILLIMFFVLSISLYTEQNYMKAEKLLETNQTVRISFVFYPPTENYQKLIIARGVYNILMPI